MKGITHCISRTCCMGTKNGLFHCKQLDDETFFDTCMFNDHYDDFCDQEIVSQYNALCNVNSSSK